MDSMYEIYFFSHNGNLFSCRLLGLLSVSLVLPLIRVRVEVRVKVYTSLNIQRDIV